MNTQAPHPAKTKRIPSISNKTWRGDLYCSKAHPMKSIKMNMTTTKVIMIGMVSGKSSEQDDASAHWPDGYHPAVVVRLATDASDASRLFNATD